MGKLRKYLLGLSTSVKIIIKTSMSRSECYSNNAHYVSVEPTDCSVSDLFLLFILLKDITDTNYKVSTTCNNVQRAVIYHAPQYVNMLYKSLSAAVV